MRQLSGDSEKASVSRSEGVCGRALVSMWGGVNYVGFLNNSTKECALELVDSRTP